MNTEILTQYNDLRTNILYDFTHSPLFKMEAEELSLFLYYWQQTHCVFTSYINRKNSPKGLIGEPKDYIFKETWDLYNNTLTDITTNAKWTDYLIEGINPLSAREFYYIEKGKYYLGYDLDEDLIGVMPYLKEQDLLEKYNEELKAYFKFRYDTYDLSLLGEFTAVPFGIHEKRLNKYKKTGIFTFDYPKEIFKYPVNEWFKQMYIPHCHKEAGTKLINIRGTNGSGKTTMVNTLFLNSTNKETKTFELTNRHSQVRKRYFDVLYDKHIILLGGYDTPYGTKGADRLGDVTEIIEGIIYVINNYPGWTIIMESATVSTSFWSYAILFDLLQKQGVNIVLVHLFMRNWEFVANNVKNRTERKEGAKEPEYDSIKNKRFILYKNHFRFNSILGKTFIAYPDDYSLEEKYKLMEEILCLK